MPMLDFLLTWATFIIPFLIVLTVVITVHELGHFLVARACGVAIDRFSIGFGRPILRWTDRSGVDWRIGWIPFGGYVRFAGDENEASVPDHESLEALRAEVLRREGPEALKRYYHFKPLWQRAAVAVAGPMANFMLAIVLFALILMTFGERLTPPMVVRVEPGSPAAAAGFRSGDLVVEVAGKPVKSSETLTGEVRLRGGVSTLFVVERDRQRVAITAVPAWKDVPDQLGGTQRAGRLGLEFARNASTEIYRRYGPAEAVAAGAERTWGVLNTTVYYLGRIIRGQVGADQISGPLGIAHLTGKVAQASTQDAPSFGLMFVGLSYSIIMLAAFVSASVGFMNLLPIPILDGGHLLFYAYEAVARRPLAAKVQAAGYRVGLALVLGLMLFATWNDLHRLRVFNFLGLS